jgi:UbiD family decarboxylase
MVPFDSLQEYVDGLESAGHLRRVSDPVDKDTELMPLVRCQFRGLPEEQRTGWLFENVTDARGRAYDVPVAVALVGASQDVYRYNLGCESNSDVAELWDAALDDPIEPNPVPADDAPVKADVETTGLEESGNGLDRLPIPISTPGFDPAPYVTAGCVIMRDPEEDVLNMGTYRGEYVSSDTLRIWMGAGQDGRKIWEKAKDRDERLDAAIVIGAPPHINVSSASKVPFTTNELGVAGGLKDDAVDVVDAETVDVPVPANAEIVVEGQLTPERYEEGPFGEYTGYMGAKTESPNFEVSCITSRADPIYQAYISQMPPSESSTIRKVGIEQSLLNAIDKVVSDVQDVALHHPAGSTQFLVIQLDKSDHGEPWQAMHTALGYSSARFKFTIAVGPDIDPHDLESVVWGLSMRVRPDEDISIERHRTSALDPASAPFDEDISDEERNYPGRTGDSAVLVDATLPWDYPPISLPRREYMEDALALWEELGYPDLELVEPWYGRSLGAWSDEDRRNADAATEGDYGARESDQS